MVSPTVVVDARNVLRSRWPNIPEATLVELIQRWTGEHDVDALVVFDGPAPEGGSGAVEVVGTGRESADDVIAREAGRLAGEGRPFWLVTSDRELRARSSGGAARVIGGGSFAGELLAG